MTLPSETVKTASHNDQPASWMKILLPPVAAAVWLVGFYLYFYQVELPNAQGAPGANTKPTRSMVWPYVGEILLDNVLPIREKGAPPSGMRFLPQRTGFLLVAGLIYAVAYLFGTGLLHLLKMNIKAVGRLEWHALALAAGLSGLSLITLGLGLLGQLNRPVFLLSYVAIAIFWALMHARSSGSFADWHGRIRSWAMLKYFKWSQKTIRYDSPRLWGFLVMAPFLLAILLGAMLPSVDFDVKEYHFGGPKEYYQTGSIHFLPHNVYTSFPFLTEMFILTGMVIYGDWFWGAIAGQTILSGFAPLTTIIVGVLARRWWGVTAGWLAAVIHLSIPWTYRISIISYTEGGSSLYLAATVLAAVICIEQLKKKKQSLGSVLLCGFLAGSAAACKYPGLISVVIPISLLTLGTFVWAVRKGTRTWGNLLQSAAIFVAGVLISFGPWLAKNLAETGNPVYPLLYSVFGGVDWDETMDEKWRRGHSPDHHQLSSLWTGFWDVFAINDWQSPLILGFALIGGIAYFRQLLPARWLVVYLAWLFLTWWALTHRLDRFWVPLLPVASCLAGAGAYWMMKHSRLVLACFMIPPIVFNLAFITTELCGYNAYTIDLNAARRVTARITSPEILFLEDYMEGRPGKVLFVGEAEIFDATFPYVYNTVFDRSLFAEWTGVVDRSQPEGDWSLKTADEIREKFQQEQISVILVNWQEILRYRTTYGYTDYVTPRRFQQLQEQGLIGAAVEPVPFYQDAKTLSEAQRREIETWAPELMTTIEGNEYFITAHVFPVP